MEVNVAVSDETKKSQELRLRHERLVHNNMSNIEEMSKLNSVAGLPDLSGANKDANTSIDTINCISCKMGKQARKWFP